MRTSFVRLLSASVIVPLFVIVLLSMSAGVVMAGFGTPKVLSGTPNRGMRDITFYGDYAICKSDKGLVVLRMLSGDSSEFVYELVLGNPIQSQLEGHFRPAIKGSVMYVPDWSEDIWVIDLTEPTLPTVVGGSPVPIDPDSCRSVAIFGDYAYVGTNGRVSGRGLVTLDISDPYQPIIVDRHPVQLDGLDMVVKNSHLYVAGFHIFTYSLAQPQSPTLLDENSSTGRAVAIRAQKDLLFVADQLPPFGENGALALFSRSDSAAPVFLGRTDNATVHTEKDVWAWGARAVALTEEGLLYVVDVSNPANPQQLPQYDTYTPCNQGMTVNGEFLYVVGKSAGVHVYRVANRGDANADGAYSAADVIWLVNYIFRSGPAPTPLEQGDCNCDGEFSSADLIYLVNFIFKGGPPPFC